MNVWTAELWPVLLPYLLAGATSVACSTLFWLIQWYRGVSIRSGTELFAVLLTADIAIYLGLIDVVALAGEFARILGPRAIVVVLGLVTILLSWWAVGYAKQVNLALDSRDNLRNSGASRGDHMRNRANYLNAMANAYLVRWLASTLHLVWIIRTPKWMIFQ